ncbi:hypothetical protein FRC04_005799 [Tulasnella sp. 424]|nr:hypothetical protein FRC04_005799 [Tulasnella sp. 424]KAG8964696.1 hypothetical protein FRC05_003595 [Tulasnella sp. 425]
MFDDLFKDIFRQLSRPNLGMARWLLDHCVTLQRRLEADPNIPEKDDIQKVIELCVTAAKRMRDGFHYDLDYPGDPVRQAVDAVTPYFPDEDKIQLPDDKVRSRALTAAIETLNVTKRRVDRKIYEAPYHRDHLQTGAWITADDFGNSLM